jgi:NAD+ diphosphatase
MPEFLAANQPDKAGRADPVYALVADGQLLCGESGLWQPLNEAAYRALTLSAPRSHFMGYLDGQPCWVVALSQPLDRKGYQWLGLRSQLGLIDETLFALAGRALQLVQWHIDHLYCGRCGNATRDADGERAKRCDACGHHYYPRLAPCMITLVTRGDECLLALHARAPQPVNKAQIMFQTLIHNNEPTRLRNLTKCV